MPIRRVARTQLATARAAGVAATPDQSSRAVRLPVPGRRATVLINRQGLPTHAGRYWMDRGGQLGDRGFRGDPVTEGSRRYMFLQDGQKKSTWNFSTE